MTQRELYEKAHAMVQARHQRAMAEMEQRREKVLRVVPQIATEEVTMRRSAAKISSCMLQAKEALPEVIQHIMTENLQAQKKVEFLLTEHGFDKKALDIQYQCTICHDTGYHQGDHCSCVRTLVQQMATKEFNKTTVMALETFDRFDLSYYQQSPQEAETMRQILEFCKQYANTFSEESKNILMMGKTGLGKTHLSLAIANQVMQHGVQVVYGGAQDFFGKIQNEYFNRNKATEDTLAMLLQADLLILDDLGAEFESNFNTSTFYNLVNGRLNRGKPTIINTNLTPQEVQARYSDRIASRLLTGYSCLRFVGVDVRQQRFANRGNGK